MKTIENRRGIIAAATLILGLSAVASADTAPPVKPDPRALGVVEQEFGRLSRDGVSAFDDIHLARMAIFDGRTDEAASFVTDATESLAKAKSDSAQFMKSEADLRPQSGAGSRLKAPPTSDATRPRVWIPIDTDIALGETFQSTPESAAAVVSLRKGLQTDDSAKALQAIRLAHIDINYTIGMAPLDESVADLGQAKTLIAAHDYYGASQALKSAEDGVRFEEIDDVANVRGKAATSVVGSK